MKTLKLSETKFRLLLLFFVLTVASFLYGQNANQNNKADKYCLKFKCSYVNPFLQENSFERIGSILAFRGGIAVKIADKKYIGLEGATSLFFPKGGGGSVGKPQILPQLKFEFTNTDKVITLITVGQLYNPSLGVQGDFEMIVNNPAKNKFILSGFFRGIAQTFDIEPGENRTQAPTSWLTVTGLQFVKPFGNNNWFFVAKSGLGLRGDSDEPTKFVGNADLVLGWNYISLIAQYTNEVPDRGFPSYFVSVVSLDITKVWRKHISKKNCKIGSYLMGY